MGISSSRRGRIIKHSSFLPPMVMLPRVIQLDTTIKDMSKLLYLVILREIHGGYRTWSSRDTLAAVLGWHKSTVTRYFNDLVTAGLISRVPTHTADAFAPPAVNPEELVEIDATETVMDLYEEIEITSDDMDELSYFAHEAAADAISWNITVSDGDWPGQDAFDAMCEPLMQQIYSAEFDCLVAQRWKEIDQRAPAVIDAAFDREVARAEAVNARAESRIKAKSEFVNTNNTTMTYVRDVAKLYKLDITDMNKNGSIPFSKIPDVVLCDRNLTDAAKLLYAGYDWYAGKNRQTFVSHGRLARDLGWKKSKVKRIACELRVAELIEGDIRIKQSTFVTMLPLTRHYTASEINCSFNNTTVVEDEPLSADKFWNVAK